jgi:hypothetical protein
MGDGEMVGSLSFPPTALADPEVARAASPERWYEIVTRGNLDRLMPPFSTLSDQERWDVVGFALSMSTDPEQLAKAEALFEASCLECHSPPTVDSHYFQSNSVAEIAALISQGRGSQMPAFGSELEVDERTTLATYVQSLGWSEASEGEVELELPTLTEGSVIGQIRNGTPDSSVPKGLEVTIHGFDGEQEAVKEIALTDASGQFQIEALNIMPGRLFFATLGYQGVSYRSELSHVPADGSPLDLSMTIYETMSDTTTLRVEQLHLLVDFPAEEVMRVLELWVVGNYTDRVLAGERLLQIDLPEQAVNLTFEEGDLGDRFDRTGSGFVDREPIPPGSGIDQLVFAFDMPGGRSVDFEQRVNYAVDAVNVLIPADGPRISGLQDQGVRDLGGFAMRSYASDPLAPGDTLSFRISGSAAASSSLTTTLIGAAVLLGAVLVAARSQFNRKPIISEQPDERNSLLRTIAQLDDDFEAGQISEQDWKRQRRALKQQALEALRASDD